MELFSDKKKRSKIISPHVKKKATLLNFTFHIQVNKSMKWNLSDNMNWAKTCQKTTHHALVLRNSRTDKKQSH